MKNLEKFNDVKLVEAQEQVIVGGAIITSPIGSTMDEKMDLYWTLWDLGVKP